MTKFGQNFGQIWTFLGQKFSKLIFHHTFGLIGTDLKFQIFLKKFQIFEKFGQNVENFALSVNFLCLILI